MKSTSTNNKVQQEGSALYIVLIVLVALSFLITTSDQVKKNLMVLSSKKSINTQSELLLSSTYRHIQKVLSIKPNWTTPLYEYQFNEELGVKLSVQNWGVKKKIKILELKTQSKLQTEYLPTWYMGYDLSTESLPSLSLSDSTSKVVLGGQSKIQGSVRVNESTIDYASRYQVRYQGKPQSITTLTWQPPSKLSDYQNWHNWITGLMADTSHSSESSHQMIKGKKLTIDSSNYSYESVYIADTIKVKGVFKSLNAQFIAFHHMEIDVQPEDTLETIRGHSYFILSSNIGDSATLNVNSWHGQGNFYCMIPSLDIQQNSSEVCTINKNVNGIGIIYSNSSLRFEGKWQGSIRSPRITYQTEETQWMNLLYNSEIHPFNEDAHPSTTIPGFLNEEF